MLKRADAALLGASGSSPLARSLPRPLAELAFFGLKQARACLFAMVIFLSVVVVPRGGLWHVPRYDLLLLMALATQAWMLWRRIETWDEAKTIAVFHVAGFVLEAFKVSPGIHSWSYPDAAYTKVLGVPLFSGFMYASVGSYVMQSWRMLEQRVERHPPYWMTGLLAAAMYLNLFTHHVLPDLRWYLAAVALGLYARCTVAFKPLDRERRMPLLLGFVLVGFFIWLAENFGTFFGIWRYPNQFGAWATVALGKWSSWAMLTLLSFTLVSNLKHVKERIHLAP
ncbi:MAG TPA: DUF817 domain-containing protein [Albitalea sp.]|nr:DUF817 domain-containing protein [Albitalea sp.]